MLAANKNMINDRLGAKRVNSHIEKSSVKLVMMKL